MEFVMKYGKENVSLNLNAENVLGTIEPNEQEGIGDPVEAIKAALANPTGSPKLREIAKTKKPNKVVIVVNDTTRPTPYNYMLPPLLEELEQADLKPDQIKFVVATGIHRGNTDKENREIFTDEIVDKYEFINHDSSGSDLISMGTLADGNEFKVNKHVAEAEIVITTGLIGLHYFAGFSGGRKSILPGVVSKDLITLNHARMTEPGAETGNYKTNPVHYIMMEAARKVGVDFIFNVVTNSKKEIVKVVAGELEQAWIEGADLCRQMNMVELKEQADVVIASAGGYPKDINIYQAQKALEHAAHAIKPGGTIMLLAECFEGFGEDVFEEWIREAKTLDCIFKRFDKGFQLGGHKAYAIASIIKDREVVLVSKMPKEDVEKLFFTYAVDIEEGLEYIAKKHGQDFKAWIMPEAGMVLPTKNS
ncbi:MAG: nickel-dependent lactate racemase [Bacillota bacterium]|nr:nickel-dependent lactate racemase [Bacillota bacterium]